VKHTEGQLRLRFVASAGWLLSFNGCGLMVASKSSQRLSFPYVFSGNPAGTRAGPPIKTFGVTTLGKLS